MTQPATRVLPAGFEACDKVTVPGDGEAELPAVHQWPGLKMTRRLQWAVCALDCGTLEGTAAVFDALWKPLAATGKHHRHLSVRKDSEGQISALIFKGEQAEPDLGTLAEQVKATSLGEIPKHGKGPSSSTSIAKYARAFAMREWRI